ncbi:hypothetical protein L1987_86619 [Smallanthus sonchifolius]|uniref:Uncharacterized protein n=1 Tax=Smallanthus sonchifolius TaxID=185202 RepID=A0ACB8Y0K0_9ASTR|nr:hypothetical protein L1987_86619 [Smallanthus sonchifolius]
MAAIYSTLLFLLTLSESFVGIFSNGVGVNYGRNANNLPPPSQVPNLLKSLTINRVKVYDSNPEVLQAFAGTDIELIVGLGNEYLQTMSSDPQQAQTWIQQNIQPYLPQTKITCINVGNEVLKDDSKSALYEYLLPAMKTMHAGLVNLGLNKQVCVTTAHSLKILASSSPPSQGVFREDMVQYINPILEFHTQVHSPFFINAYPYFAYESDPNNVRLEYALFEPNEGVVDPNTKLKYDNMLYAQIDAVYSAIKALGFTDIEVKISETGWPSTGDENETGATVQNAGLYNRNLMQRMQHGQGTPTRPSQPIDIYIFALFNEDMKDGLTSERNFGLYYPNGTLVYNLGVQSYAPPRIEYSSSHKNVRTFFSFGFVDLTPCLRDE